MIIANPIYDVVFKRLMENERVAKFFISTLLRREIHSIRVRPQEFTYTDESRGIAVFRLDFIAIVETEDGGTKKILIEMQKVKNHIDLIRFRSYLAEQYKKEDVVDGEKLTLPITTIYILGFKIPEIKSACFHVERRYKDLIDNKLIEEKSYFVERLSHDSYVVQVKRIGQRYQTRLDKLLSVFEQRHFTDATEVVKEYKYEIDEEEVKVITEILHYSGTDPEARKALEIEQEAWRTIDAYFAEKERKYQKKLLAVTEELNEKGKELDEKNKALDEKKRTLEEQDKLLEEQKRLIEELRQRLESDEEGE
ncbi:MAG: hypothetical protein AAF798_05675 [Bacteroidota bacterium]